MPVPKVKTVDPASDGIWRIGRGSNPLALRPPEPNTLLSSTLGNRFDSPDGKFVMLYFGTMLETCFVETLARFRPDLDVVAVIKEEWEENNFMVVGSVPQEWRVKRSAVRVQVAEEFTFLDVESPDTHQYLRDELALGLSALGYKDLDSSTVRGPDRRVTRLIADWAFQQTNDDGSPTFGGIRYHSRIGGTNECWAVFHDVPVNPIETRPIVCEMPELLAVANQFDLRVF
jgi:hypothetical protein